MSHTLLMRIHTLVPGTSLLFSSNRVCDSIPPLRCTVRVIDDRGKEYVHEIKDLVVSLEGASLRRQSHGRGSGKVASLYRLRRWLDGWPLDLKAHT